MTNPLLMVVLVAGIDLGAILGVYAPVAFITAVAAGSCYVLGSWLVLKRSAGQTTVGAVLAILDRTPPELIWAPMEMLGRASIPLLLFVFGLSLASQRPFRDPTLVSDIAWGSFIKLILMPVTAWLLGP